MLFDRFRIKLYDASNFTWISSQISLSYAPEFSYNILWYVFRAKSRDIFMTICDAWIRRNKRYTVLIGNSIEILTTPRKVMNQCKSNDWLCVIYFLLFENNLSIWNTHHHYWKCRDVMNLKGKMWLQTFKSKCII